MVFCKIIFSIITIVGFIVFMIGALQLPSTPSEQIVGPGQSLESLRNDANAKIVNSKEFLIMIIGIGIIVGGSIMLLCISYCCTNQEEIYVVPYAASAPLAPLAPKVPTVQTVPTVPIPKAESQIKYDVH